MLEQGGWISKESDAKERDARCIVAPYYQSRTVVSLCASSKLSVFLVVSSTACCDWLHEITVSSLHSTAPVTKRRPTYEYLEENPVES
jgi:hypothetical protein